MPNPPKPPSKGPSKPGGVSRTWWIVGAGGVVAIVWYASHKAKAPTTTDPTAALDPSIDPATGIPYAQEYSGYDNTGYSAPVGDTSFTGAIPQQPSTMTLDGSATAPQSLNAWLLEAEAALLSMGYDPNVVSSTLGNLASGTPLNSTQSGAAASAAGAVGAPPTSTSTTPTATATSPAPQPAPPSPAPATLPTMTAPTLHGYATADHKAVLEWTIVQGAKGYNIYYNGVYHLYHTMPSYESAARTVGSHYGPVTVKAVRSDGKVGPASNPITVTIR